MLTESVSVPRPDFVRPPVLLEPKFLAKVTSWLFESTEIALPLFRIRVE